MDTAIDISPGMVERGRRKATAYEGAPDVRVMNVRALEFPAATFGTIATAAPLCTKSGLLGRGPLDWEGSTR